MDLNQSRYQGQQNALNRDIDFNGYIQSMENILQNNQIGFKYLEQLNLKAQKINQKIEFYIQKLKMYNPYLIIYCEFTFDKNLQLYIKEQNIVQEFLNQPPPNVNGVKIKQSDLIKALGEIKDQVFKQFQQFNLYVENNSQLKGNIQNKIYQYLNNNNEKQSQNFYNQAEKHRNNMTNQLIKTENLTQYVEFQFYFDNYVQYFDVLPIKQREEIYQLFKQFLKDLDDNQDLKQFTRNHFQNNNIKVNNKTYYVNSIINPQNQILIPKFLWTDISNYQLQGYILYIMIQLQEFNLNFNTMLLILQESKQDHQRYKQYQIQNWRQVPD